MPGDLATEYRLLESVPDAVVITGPSGLIVFANRQAERLTGYRRAELVGRRVELLVPADLRRGHVRHRRDFYRRGTARPMGKGENGFRLRRKDGTDLEVEISLGPAGQNTMAVIRDVTERHAMEKALEHRALHDPLTDLANRSLFFDRLHQSIQGARRDGSLLALVLMDVDGFKSINDTHGHAVGDEVLREMAARLRSGLRGTDTVARLGGDEFAWILPRLSGRRAAQRIVRKRLADAHRQVVVRKLAIQLALSAGIAMYPEDGRDADTLIRHADSAMYAAKREGRGLAFHSPTGIGPKR